MKRTDILNFLDELFPNAHCELVYNNHFELLIAIILSAQTTDLKVNKISPFLFEKYTTPSELSNAKLEDVVEILKPLGLANVKAKNIINTAKSLIDNFDGIVPKTMDELLTLSGVGNKTANVFLAEGYNERRFAVDTHVSRVSRRLEISKSENPLKIEEDLKVFFKDDDWTRLHHKFIFFGRYFCMAKKPLCNNCKLKKYCSK